MQSRIASQLSKLVRGQRYLAGRPFASRGRKTYPVTIYKITHGFSFQNWVVKIDGLTYDQANELLAAFNGPASFDGRVW